MDTINSLPPIVLAAPDYDALASLIEDSTTCDPAVSEFLNSELERADVVETANLPAEAVTMHRVVAFREDASGRERTVTLVFPGEEDIAAGRISVLTPIGAALIGLSKGQSIEWTPRIGASRRLTVLDVSEQAAD